LSPSTWAVNPASHISQYGHSAWRILDGYLPGKPNAVTQTIDGYLWVGTDNGLLRFDGVRFVPWTPPAGQRLPSSTIRALLRTFDGSLWIATNSGLSRWFNNNLVNLDLHGVVDEMVEDKDHSVWAIYGESPRHTLLCHIVETTPKCYDEKDGASELGGPLALDGVGNLWLGTRRGVLRWRPNSFAAHNIASLQSMEGVDTLEAVTVSPEGSILGAIGMPGRGLGLEELTDGVWKPYRKPGFDGSTVTAAALFVDRQDSLWIASLAQGLFRVHGQTVEHYGSADGLSGDSVRKLYEDREGNLWVLTSRGIDLLRDLRVVSFSTREGLGTEEVDSVRAASDGRVWVGGAESLDIIRRDGISSVRTGKGLPGGQVGAIFEDHTGQLWIGVDQKLFVYKDGKFKPITRSDGSPIGLVGTIAEDRDNNIWLSAFHESAVRLLRIRDFKIEEEIVHTQQEPANPPIPRGRLAIADADGNLWLAPSSGGLARITKGRAEIFRYDGISDSRATQLILALDGSILGATSSGVIAWKNGNRQILTTLNGLPCNVVNGLVNDASGNLWLNLQCGLVDITKADLEKWWEKSDTVVHPRVFDVLDGWQPGSAPWSSATRSTDGRLWFANRSVLQMIDPSHIPVDELPPPVHVEQIVADRKAYSPQNRVTIPSLTRDLEIDYTALSLGVPQKVFFRYKLEGRESNWTDALARRQAFYNDLRPGHYRFRVIACNNDGVWNEAGAALDFSILPAYYQTAWFRMACAGAVLLSLWIIYQFRVRQLQRQFAIGLEARSNERTRIARELHDTLLQSLHGLMFQFQGARNLLPRRPDDAMRSLDDAIGETKKALAESRDAIQGLRLEPIATGNLAELLISASRELASSATDPVPQPVFDLIEEGEQQLLSPATSNEICRIALEILRNAYRHAHSRQIEAEIRYGDDMLRLRIRDDGRGIDPDVLEEGGRAGHWGLRGIRERAERIGASVEFWSELGKGTEVELAIPATVAYESTRDSYRARLLRKVTSRAHRS
jgi:signal transduction histidine kinase/ligand-binding sensor domain-containing protein